MIDLSADFEFYVAIDNHHDLIRRVNEILPSLPRRVGPEAATETAFSPSRLYGFLVHNLNYSLVRCTC